MTLNVYANYGTATGQVCDGLEVDLHQADGREEAEECRLNAAKKAVLLRKMDKYCQQQTGQTLAEYSPLVQRCKRPSFLFPRCPPQQGPTSPLCPAGWHPYPFQHCAALWRLCGRTVQITFLPEPWLNRGVDFFAG